MGHSHHHYRPFWRRGLYSFILVLCMMAVGTIGMHAIEQMSYLDAFYFMSMIATAQGPMSIPTTPVGKLFVSVMAFVSVGSVVASLGFLFGPFFGQLWKVGVDKIEEEAHLLTKGPHKRL